MTKLGMTKKSVLAVVLVLFLFQIGGPIITNAGSTSIGSTLVMLDTSPVYIPSTSDGMWNIYINRNKVTFTKDLGSPELVNNRTMVPLRVISEQMGYDVSWNQSLRKVTIVDAKTKVEISIGQSVAYVDGVKKPIDIQNGKAVDTKAYIKNDRTMVPLRFISEAFGAEVGYNQVNGNHYITILTMTGEVVDPVYTGEIPFDKSKDIMDDGSGRMSKEKTIEYLDKMIANTKVYTENGKYYLKYDKVDVPQGFSATIGMGIDLKMGTNVSIKPMSIGYDPIFNLEENTIPRNASFVKELRKNAVENSDLFMLTLCVSKDNYSGEGQRYAMNYQINFCPITKETINTEKDKWNNGGTVPFDGDLIFKDFKLLK